MKHRTSSPLAVPIAFLFALFAGTTHAAEPTKHVILADLGLHVIGAGYQHTLGPTVAVQIALEYYAPWTQNLDLAGLSGEAYMSDLTGGVVRGRVFVYPFGKAPGGFWISPFAQGGLGKATIGGERRSSTLWAAGASVGYAFRIGRALYVAVGGGAQLHNGDIAGVEGPPDFHRLYPQLDLNVGYGF